jgi:hypothetical protein
MISLIIAGGVSLAASAQPTNWPDIDNHTLKAEVIASSQVVTRNRWGTPMLPDGKGGYSLIAPINQAYILQSLIIPPWNIPKGMTTDMVIYRPLPAENEVVSTTIVVPVEAAPVEPLQPPAPMDATQPVLPAQ